MMHPVNNTSTFCGGNSISGGATGTPAAKACKTSVNQRSPRESPLNFSLIPSPLTLPGTINAADDINSLQLETEVGTITLFSLVKTELSHLMTIFYM